MFDKWYFIFTSATKYAIGDNCASGLKNGYKVHKFIFVSDNLFLFQISSFLIVKLIRLGS